MLTIELLRSKLSPIKKKFDDLKADRAFRCTVRLHQNESIDWLVCKIEDLKNLVPYLQSSIADDLVASWGHSPQLGDPHAILVAIEKICEGSRQLLHWEEEIRFTALPTQLQEIQKTLRGTTEQFFAEVISLADKLDTPFKMKMPSGKHDINLAFNDPANMPELNRQLSQLQQDIEINPGNWIGWR